MNFSAIKNKLFLLLQYCIPQHALSRFAGRLADSETPWLKNLLIRLFANNFPINIDEAQPADFEKYPSFNAFFTRPLKANARPIQGNDKNIVSPVDGAISEIGSINGHTLIQAKGHHYSLSTLLGDDEQLSRVFNDGLFSTIYLSPKDYHRIHMPIDGELKQTIYIPGSLFSVNQTTANNVSNLFARNERLVCVFETAIGPMVLILVGAMIVASIETVWSGQVTPQTKHISKQDFSGNIALKKGEEMGRFKLGSTVIVLFAKDSIIWNDLLEHGLGIKLGEVLGEHVES